MTRIVLVHGIGQQHSTADAQARQWLPSLVQSILRSGQRDATRASAELLAGMSGEAWEAPVQMAFYGDLFLTPDTQGDGAVGLDPYARALASALAEVVLRTAEQRGGERLRREARSVLEQADPSREQVQGVGAVMRNVIAALDGRTWLCTQIFGRAQAARADLEQVAQYMSDDELRTEIQQRLCALLEDDTRVVIGHSLGSVVAWEACRSYDGSLPLLVTLGSPLGLGTIIYPRLRPAPPVFPPALDQWVNVAHPDDFIAVEQRLEPLFPSDDSRLVEDHTPKGRAPYHAAAGYLEDGCVGEAVAGALLCDG
jgi:hypothetical protein